YTCTPSPSGRSGRVSDDTRWVRHLCHHHPGPCRRGWRTCSPPRRSPHARARVRLDGLTPRDAGPRQRSSDLVYGAGEPPCRMPVVTGPPQVLLGEHLAAGPTRFGWLPGELRRAVDAQLVTVVALEEPATGQVQPDQGQVRGLHPTAQQMLQRLRGRQPQILGPDPRVL